MSPSDSPLPPRETLLVVTIYEELPDVLARLRAYPNSAVRLEIPPSSPLFLTATDFRALRDVAQYRRIALTIVTDDPLRRRLAEMFHISVAGTGDPWTPSPGPPPPPLETDVPPPVPSWGSVGLPPLPGAEPAPTGRRRPEPTPSDQRYAERERGTRRPYSIEPRPAGPAPRKDDPARPLRRGASTLPPPVPNRSLPYPGESTSASASRRASRADDIGERGPRSREADSHLRRSRGGQEIRWPAPPEGASRRGRPIAQPGQSREGAEEGQTVASQTPSADRGPAARGGRPPSDRIPRHRTGDAGGGRGDTPGGWTQRLRDIPPRIIAIVVGALALVIFLVYSITMLAFSSAQVTLALSASPVATSATCDVVAPGLPSDAEVVIEAMPFETTISYQGSIPTTGTRPDPTELARGEVVFANPTGAEVTIEAGTELTGANGRIYRTTEAVTIQPGDPNTGHAAYVSVPVEAAQPGAASNLDAGQLTGQLDNGVYYSNRNGPIEGGLDADVRTVAPADVANLREQATTELERLAQEGQVDGIPAGAAVIPESVQVADPEFEEDHQAGDDAEDVAITATARITLLIYQPDDVRTAADTYLRQKLGTTAPADHVLDEESIEIGDLQQESSDAQHVRFMVNGNAMAIPTFTEDDRQELAARLEGKDADEAAAILREIPTITSFEVSYAPRWLPDRMPSSASRIEIEVTS